VSLERTIGNWIGPLLVNEGVRNTSKCSVIWKPRHRSPQVPLATGGFQQASFSAGTLIAGARPYTTIPYGWRRATPPALYTKTNLENKAARRWRSSRKPPGFTGAFASNWQNGEVDLQNPLVDLTRAPCPSTAPHLGNLRSDVPEASFGNLCRRRDIGVRSRLGGRGAKPGYCGLACERFL